METISGVTSTISRNIKIKGKLTSNKGLKIAGKFEGEISLTGIVYIQGTGEVQAKIETDELLLEGRLEGSVIARKSIRITKTGSLIGDIQLPLGALNIEEGAVFEGKVAPIQKTIPKPNPKLNKNK